MAVYTLRDGQTGRTVKVRGDTPPSPEQQAQIFADVEQKLTAGKAASNDMYSANPTEGMSGMDKFAAGAGNARNGQPASH